ncbi:MAG: pseudouridine synthase [Halobacteriovoraceae bacterium]|nr:pseudouridine synthase [Halobacteriovoraceae bacterium]
MKEKKIPFSILHNWSSGRDFLKKGMSLSHQKIKKAGLSKDFLDGKIDAKKEISLPLNLMNSKEISPFYLENPMEIIMEDENILALNKLPGIHSHPLNYDETNNCLSFIRNIGKGDILYINRDSRDRGLLYRLDYETSGVLVYIKKQELFEKLRKNFHQAIRHKRYVALISGKHHLTGEFAHNLNASGRKGGFMKASEGDKAVMRIKNCHYLDFCDLSIVEIFLKTGFRHQIRSQLAALGMPVLGDVLYGGEKSYRMFLHAFYYEICWGDNLYKIKCMNAPLFDKFFKLNDYLS